jgi:hypothetical protein
MSLVFGYLFHLIFCFQLCVIVNNSSNEVFKNYVFSQTHLTSEDGS